MTLRVEVKNGFVEAWTEDSLVAILTEEEAKELVDHLLTTWHTPHNPGLTPLPLTRKIS